MQTSNSNTALEIDNFFDGPTSALCIQTHPKTPSNYHSQILPPPPLPFSTPPAPPQLRRRPLHANHPNQLSLELQTDLNIYISLFNYQLSQKMKFIFLINFLEV